MQKKSFLYLLCLISLFTYSQNLITNGNFETGTLESWDGYSNQVLTDNLTNSLCGNNNNGNSSSYQIFTVTPEETYEVAFKYRWLSGTTGTYNMTARIKDGATGGSDLGTLALNTTPDVWHNAYFTFTAPVGITTARIIFFKPAGNRPFRFDNVYIAPQSNNNSLIDSNTPINAQPLGIAGNWNLDFSDEFNDTQINPLKWIISVSNSSRAPRPSLGIDDWWWVQSNAFLNGTGDLVLRGTKVDNNTMHCGSIESRNLYEPTFGFLEARIKIAETAKGNHTAFWTQGSNMGNVDNSAEDGAEIDIFESAWITNTTKAVVHFDGYGPDKKNHTIPYNTPNLHTGYHTFGLHWTSTFMNIYYDGVLVQSTNSNKPFPFTVDPNGYPLIPQVPEWLWLSVGASFGDGDFQSQQVGTLSDALVDYVRVYKDASTLGIENNISKEKFKTYPNPTKGKIHIKTDASDYLIKIYDLTGKKLLELKKSKSQIIDVSTFKKGMYLFQIHENKNVSTQKIIIN